MKIFSLVLSIAAMASGQRIGAAQEQKHRRTQADGNTNVLEMYNDLTSYDEICVDGPRIIERKIPYIKLTPENAIEPDIPLSYTFGAATWTVGYQKLCDRDEPLHFTCLDANLQGFVPEILQIANGKINEVGRTIADFSPALSNREPRFRGCAEVLEDEWLDLIRNPDEHYIRASPGPPAGDYVIRGQIWQAFPALLSNDQVVAPFDTTIDGASGRARINVEEGGNRIFFDATIDGFDPEVAKVSRGDEGENGVIVLNFSDTKIGKGRFLGSMTLEELDVDHQVIIEMIADPGLYYFSFQGGTTAPEAFTSIRGQVYPYNADW